MNLTQERTERVDVLLQAMSRDEKLLQLQVTFRMDAEENAAFARAGIGALFWPMSAAATNELQRVACTESAHGIPLLIGLDVIHGQRTIFPIPLAQACAFDPSVALLDGQVSGAEARSGGVNWAFSPMIDVSRDARWGRVCEGFGEDALLNSVYGAAKVRGFQGTALSSTSQVAACAKHFVAYGAAEGGRDYNTVDMSERRLRDAFLKPFHAAVEAGAASVMASFNTVSGVPVHANRHLLTEVLKAEWGFSGVVVGDADGVANLIAHGVASDRGDARRQSFAAGLDIEMGMDLDAAALVEDLTALDDERLDDAVRRVLNLKMALGLFDNPYVDEASELLEPSDATLEAAYSAAVRSAVLLRNDGTLPLRADTRRVLVTGPYAESTDHLGAWVQRWAEAPASLADVLGRKLQGADVTVIAGTGFFDSAAPDSSGIAAAASAADLVIVAVGEPSNLSGEAASRADIRLPGQQEALIHAIAESGTPFVVVVCSGRPLVVADWCHKPNAILQAWHLGSRAPEAIADLLLGTANPAGRLAMGFPRSVGQLPMHYDHENTGRPASSGGRLSPDSMDVTIDGPANVADHYTSKYRDLQLGPEFEFGHGLSYSTFEHDLHLASSDRVRLEDLKNGEQVRIDAIVRNTSATDGDEVLLVFIRDLVASAAQPVRRLVAFTRTAVAGGAAQPVQLEFGFDALSFWKDDGAGFRVEPGEFRVFAGPRPDALQEFALTVVA